MAAKRFQMVGVTGTDAQHGGGLGMLYGTVAT
jgi:hypothetical protein